MLQDIAPKRLDNRYHPDKQPQGTDLIIIFTNHQVILKNRSSLPTFKGVDTHWHFNKRDYTYLLSVSGVGFFMVNAEVSPSATYTYVDPTFLLRLKPQWLAFGSSTATQLANWYVSNQFCGRCGHRTERSMAERALVCPNCHRTVYPTIAPAIIVAVTNGDRILLTKSLVGNRFALISGYTEIGETLEDTVHREVYEEVGLRVHNLRYYGGQPWAVSHSLLVGYVADLDEAVSIKLEHDELTKAQWFDRDKIPQDGVPFSLTWDMIEAFRHHQI
ncbi:NAD(+) diphosphatase [Secundilactobacillus folii]|uniref:NAD(+) diphosphatase n=1 Tax=Secundilactobacillus folii TaxID=2678357 RepID=UPI0012D48769|nr:NAD(+) diphosphatase [Secundilactobacillus folii]